MVNLPARPAFWLRLARKSASSIGLLSLAFMLGLWGLLRQDSEIVPIAAAMWAFAYVVGAPYIAAETGRNDHRMAGALIAWGSTPWLALLAYGDRLPPGGAPGAFLAAMVIGALALGVARIGIWRLPSILRQVVIRLAGVIYLLWIAAYVDLARMSLSFEPTRWRGADALDIAFVFLLLACPAPFLALWAGLRLALARDEIPAPPTPP